MKYTKEQLKKIQEYELEIYKDFKQICDENNFHFIAIGGTAIGSIRHKGFIPWDDDIDVALPYEQYIKVNKIFKEKFSDKYIVVNAETFPDYPNMNEHIVMKGTQFVTKDAKNLKYPQGIFLDIFPEFKTPKDKTLNHKHSRSAYIWNKIMILREIPFPNISFKGIKGKIIHIGTFITSYLIKLIFSHNYLYNKTLKTALKYDNLAEYDYEFFFSPHCGESHQPGNVFDEPTEMPFEDTTMSVSKDVDTYLKKVYGDYMQLPPEEKRIGHAPLILKFKDEG